MVFGFSKARYSPIAVDFGADSIKLLQVVANDPPQLVAAAAAVVPEHARNDPAARHAFFAEALKQLLKSQPFKGRRAICSIPAFQTLVQHLQINRVESEDVSVQLGLHLRERLNIDPLRMVIRHFPVTQVVREGSTKQEIICFAASRESVMRHIETAHRAKLDVIGMYCEPQAILAAFEHTQRSEGDKQKITCFIDIGAATTKVLIMHGKDFAFAKTIHAAGDHFIRHRAKQAGVSFDEARALRIAETGTENEHAAEPTAAMAAVNKPTHGTGGMAAMEARIVAERGTKTTARPSPAATAQNEPDADTLECLIDELQLCVRYHKTLFPNHTIEKLVFLGGESRHTSTCQKIARALRIGAQLGDPMARVLRINQAKNASGVDLNQPLPGWAVPLGLCLSEPNL